MVTIRHRSASGTLDECWQLRLEPDGPRILATFRLGNATHELDVAICVPPRARHCAHILHRIGDNTWSLVPSVAMRLPNGTDWELHMRALCGALSALDGVLLTCAPDEVNAQLEAL